MYRKAISGQFLYFNLVSITSGTVITGGAAAISGRRSLDGAAHTLVSGTFSELAGGQYVFNGFDFDFNGNNIGFLITASNAVPISFTVVTNATISGDVFLSSGQIVGLRSGGVVTLASGSLSGQLVTAASGVFGTASLNSGQSVIPYSGQLSGQFVTANVIRWQGVSPNALISSGRLDAAFNVRTDIARSGTSTTIQLDAGVPTGVSGVYDNSILTLVGGTGAGRSRAILNMGSSGIAFISPPWDASGVPDNTSIYTITPAAQPFSGTVFIASGPSAVVSLYSGQFTLPYSGQLSGQLVTAASGQFVTASLNSGQSVLVYSGQLSGHPINTFVNLDKSGYTANSISGTTQLASGQAVNLLSGNVTSPYSGSLSGQFVASFSGATVVVVSGLSTISTLYSGQLSIPYSGQMSGQFVTTQINLDKSGYTANSISGTTYPASGLNSILSGQQVVVASFLSGAAKSIMVEGGITPGSLLVNDAESQLASIDLPQAIAAILATQAGRASGAGTNSFAIGAAGSSGSVNRIVATIDASGNRTTITLKVPN